MNDSLVIIPTYNEKENIEAIIEAIISQPKEFDILIVDDCSPDGTSDLVKKMIEKQYNSRLFLEIREKKSGLGTAYIHGFKWAIKRNYQYIIEMDADFSHNPDDLPRLYKTCKEQASIVVGSRYLDNGINVINWDIKRILLSYVASKYVRIVTGLPVHDTTAGFVCYRRDVLKTINLDQINSLGYTFQIEMKYKAWKHGFKIKEISILFRDRIHGVSKMNGSIIFEAIIGVIKMRIQGVKNSKKIKS